MGDLSLLSQEERELLLGLALVVVGADGALSVVESEGLRRLGEKMGALQFVECARVARERFPDDESTLAAARELQGQRAREVLFRELEELAECGGLTEHESRVLRELRAAWGMDAE